MKKIVSFLYCLAFLIQVRAQLPLVAQKVSSPGHKRGEYFGYALTLTDSFLFVGTNDLSSGTAQSSEPGSVYVLKKDSINLWHFHQHLRSVEKHDYDRFGERVYVDSQTLIISAYQHQTDAEGEHSMDRAGALFVYELRADGSWGFKQKVVAQDRSAFDQFGIRVGIKGDVMVVGANGDKAGVPGYNERNSHAGSAYIFKRDSIGRWKQFQKLRPSDGAHRSEFGEYLAFSGKHIVISAPGDGWVGNHSNAVNTGGVAYIFKEDSTGQWVEYQKVRGHQPKYLDRFGWGIGISDSLLLIGANLEEHTRADGRTIKDAGAVYAYLLDSSGLWQEQERIVACDTRVEAAFGYSISLSGNRAIIGAPHCASRGLRMSGAAYFYQRDQDGKWQLIRKALEDQPGKDYRFGTTTAISDHFFAIGAYRSGSSRGNGPVHKKWGEVFIGHIFPKKGTCASEKITSYKIKNNHENNQTSSEHSTQSPTK